MPFWSDWQTTLSPGMNPALSPSPSQLNMSGPPRQTLDNPDLMRMVVDMITMDNTRVKKFNLFRRQCHLDMSYNQLVSDDKDESPIPDISCFVNPVISAQNPTPLVTPQAHSPHPHPNLTLAPNASSPNAVTIGSHLPDPFSTTSDNLSLVLPVDWHNFVTKNNGHVNTTEPMSAKTIVVDYQNLSPIYSLDDLTKNKHQLDMMDIPNTILHMVFNKIYILLTMLTTPALTKVHTNDNLKLHKIPFGNGIGKQSLNKASFPGKDSLMETSFLQAYRNWLTIIDSIATPDGWYEHHSRMSEMRSSPAFIFQAWREMDEQLCTQFITCPFAIDPYSATYIQLMECSCMDSFLTHAEKAKQNFENQWATCTNMPHPSQSENRYAPYNKDAEKGGHLESFHKTKKPILCL